MSENNGNAGGDIKFDEDGFPIDTDVEDVLNFAATVVDDGIDVDIEDVESVDDIVADFENIVERLTKVAQVKEAETMSIKAQIKELGVLLKTRLEEVKRARRIKKKVAAIIS